MNPIRLAELLKGHKTYIQTHNFPDPDAVASAFGLQKFLQFHGVETTLCYDGKIDKLNMKNMLALIPIDFLPGRKTQDMSPEDYIVTVDTQMLSGNRTDFAGRGVACIDHHPEYECCEYEYRDIRMTGACATIIASYFKETDTPMDQDTATALAYGIKMDTAEFTRGVTDLDIEMFAYTFLQADRKVMQELYINMLEFKDLKAYGAAVETAEIYEDTAFACLPFDCPDALIAIISDFILSLNGVNVSLVYAIRPDGIKISARSSLERVHVGRLLNHMLKELGSGGGHQGMAGGFIPEENRSRLGGDLHDTVRRLFLEELENMRTGQ